MDNTMSPALSAMIPAVQRDGLVLSRQLENGMELLVYPIQPGDQVLVGVGYGREQAHRIDALTLLRRRGADLARYGDWQPARFQDGSWFVLRRWAPEAEGQDWSDAALGVARELLQ